MWHYRLERSYLRQSRISIVPGFQRQMTAEVVAACKGASAAGAKEIVVRDAHDTARNLIAAESGIISPRCKPGFTA